MQSTIRTSVDLVIHWPAGPAPDGSDGPMIGAISTPPPGELRTYLRDLALGRR